MPPSSNGQPGASTSVLQGLLSNNPNSVPMGGGSGEPSSGYGPGGPRSVPGGQVNTASPQRPPTAPGHPHSLSQPYARSPASAGPTGIMSPPPQMAANRGQMLPGRQMSQPGQANGPMPMNPQTGMFPPNENAQSAMGQQHGGQAQFSQPNMIGSSSGGPPPGSYPYQGNPAAVRSPYNRGVGPPLNRTTMTNGPHMRFPRPMMHQPQMVPGQPQIIRAAPMNPVNTTGVVKNNHPN